MWWNSASQLKYLNTVGSRYDELSQDEFHG